MNGRTRRDARVTTRQFGVCAAARAPGPTEALLALPVDAPEMPKLMNRVATEDCLGSGELRMSTSLMRSALFEAMYLKRFGGRAAATFEDVPPINYRQGYGDSLSDEGQTAIALVQFGDCVARADPRDAQALILSNPESGAEATAVSGLLPKLGGCILKDQKITFSRSVLRGALAEATYRLSLAKAAQP